MKARTLTAAIAAIAVVAAAGLVVAAGTEGGPFSRHGKMHGKGFGGGPGGLGFLGRMVEQLGLSEEQQAQIESIINEEQPAIDTLHEQLAANRESFHESFDPGSFDEATVRTQAQAQAALMVEMRVATARLRSRIYSVLTEEQQQQLQELREQRESCRGKMDGPGHGPGHGHGGDDFGGGPGW